MTAGKSNIRKSCLLLAPLLLAGAGATFLLAGPDAPYAVAPKPVAAPQVAPYEAPLVAGDHGFRFARVWYRDSRGMGRLLDRGWGRRGGNRWATDWPAAETNLDEAIKRTTELHVDGPPVVLSLADERIFDYPVLYLTEPGYWYIDSVEVANVQKYFERGGFMIIDDFHDYEERERREWGNFYYNIKQIFPDREPVPLPPDHPIWSIYYDIDPIEAASTKDYEGFGRYDDEYYAIYDDAGRMMVVICYKQDIGDGWEWPDRNLQDASTVSFQMAINFLMWALTH